MNRVSTVGRHIGRSAIAGLAILSIAAAGASAATGETKGPEPTAGGAATQQGNQPVTPEPVAPATPVAEPVKPVPDAAAKPKDPALEAIKARGRTLPGEEGLKSEKGLQSIVQEVDAEAVAKGHDTIAMRLGEEFGMSADALSIERSRFATGWGDLMIAHTLLASAATPMTVDQLYEMRSEGMGWGQIAHGLGFKVGPLMSAVKAESRVAKGLSKGDGKVAQLGRSAAATARGSKDTAPGERAEKVSPAQAGSGAETKASKGKGGK